MEVPVTPVNDDAPGVYPNCSVDLCDPDPCNGHGACDSTDGSCTCDNDYMNADCSACVENYVGYPDCVSDSDDDGIPEGDGSNPCTGGGTTACDDNCPNDSNSDQADMDSDGIGDVCDRRIVMAMVWRTRLKRIREPLPALRIPAPTPTTPTRIVIVTTMVGK